LIGRRPVGKAIGPAVDAARDLLDVVLVGEPLEPARLPELARREQRDVAFGGEPRIAFEVHADLGTHRSIVGAAGQLEDAATVVEHAIAGLRVAEIGSAFVAAPVRGAAEFFERAKARGLVRRLREEVAQPAAVLQDAVGFDDVRELVDQGLENPRLPGGR